MNDVPSRLTRGQILVLAAVVALAGAAGLVAWWQYEPRDRPTSAGELITVAGRYLSPGGTTILLLEPSGDGATLHVHVASHEGSPDYAAHSCEIDGAKRWFFIFGEDDKLWGYSEDRGPFSWQGTSEASRYTKIGIYGGWAGLPDSFLESLPEVHRRTYARWLDASASR